MTAIPPMNLPPAGMPWARWIQNAVTGIQSTLSRMGTDAYNANHAQSSALGALGSQIVNLNSKFQAALAALTVAPSQVSPGTFGAGVLLPSGNISGAIPTSALTGDYTTGNVTATAALKGADVYATNAPGYNITGTRVAGWWESATGRAGTASSSSRYKTNIVPAATDPNALYGIPFHYYNYIAEVAKRDDPTSPDYVGPDYKVHLEIGGIAEEFHAAGLWEFVVYLRDEDGNLTLDDNGAPIPDGLHYELLGVGALIAAQDLNKKLIDLTARVAKLEGTATA